MNIFQKTLLFAAAIVCMTMLSGCLLAMSNFSGQVCNIGETKQYADLSKIEDKKVYELDGKYFIKAPITLYKYNAPWFIFWLHSPTYDKTGELGQPRWIKINDNTQKFLCEKKQEKKFIHKKLSGVILETAPDMAAATVLQAENVPTVELKNTICTSQSDADTAVDLGSNCSWYGYAAMPLLLVTIPLDIATAVLTNTAILLSLPVVAIFSSDSPDDVKKQDKNHENNSDR